MSREVKRVPLDFSWPMHKVWYGFMIRVCFDGEGKLACKDCRQFARLKNMPVKDEKSCPVFDFQEPPKGEGWQMWETTSEGSPISPVFKTPEKLARWLSDNKASSFGSCTATYDEWLAMIKEGWAPSGVLINGECMSGVEAASKLEASK